MLMSSRADETHLPTDRFPPLAVCSQPNDLGVDRIKPMQPTKCFLHPTDGIRRRRRQPHRLRLLTDTIGKLHDHLWPRVEVPWNTDLRQPLHRRGGFDEALFDQRGCPCISAIARLRASVPAIKLLTELTDELALGPSEPLIVNGDGEQALLAPAICA